MAELWEIVSFLDEYLKISEYPDKSSNGLQVEGKEEVKYTAKELGILGVNALANVVIITWQFPFSVRVLRMD